MTDQYGADLSRIIQDLTRRVQKLEAAARGGSGLQIGQASSAFLLPDAGPGTPPPGAVYLYSDNGTFKWRSDSGGIYSGIPPQADDSGAVVSSDADGTYSAGEQVLINELKTRVNQMRTELRLSGLMA